MEKKQSLQSAGGKRVFPPKKKKHIGVFFECCNIYTRVYINKSETAYVGWCPKCAQRVAVKIDKRGTDCRFFKLVKH